MTTQVLTCPVAGIQLNRGFDPGPMAMTRWFITGANKTGQTSFGASIPGAFHIDLEDKLRFVETQYRKITGSAQPTTLQQLDAVVDWLCAEKKAKGDKFPIQHVVLDTSDELLYSILIPGMTKELVDGGWNCKAGQDVTDYGAGGGKGSKGWSMVTLRAASLLRKLKAAGMGWTSLGHQKLQINTIRQDGTMVDVTTRRPAVNPGFYGLLKNMAEFTVMTFLRNKETKTEKILKHHVTGKEYTVPQVSRSTVGLLMIRESVGDSNEDIGSNVTLPAEVEVQQGRAWETVETLYNASVAREKSE